MHSGCAVPVRIPASTLEADVVASAIEDLGRRAEALDKARQALGISTAQADPEPDDEE